jgi:hypothetical protein
MPQQRPSTDGSEDISESNLEKTLIKAPRAVIEGAELVTKDGHVVTKDGALVSVNEPEAGVKTNPFSDPEVRDYYVAMYEKSQYECRHVFDADLTWTQEEEKKLVRKLDLRGMNWRLLARLVLMIL